jgi:hypothetical protein
MKNNQQQTNFFFSDYPSQVLNFATEEKRPYLRVYKNEDIGAQRSITSKNLPAISAYNDPQLIPSTEEKNIELVHIEERESDWFASYE